jgi:hypothetical protein
VLRAIAQPCFENDQRPGPILKSPDARLHLKLAALLTGRRISRAKPLTTATVAVSG